MSTGNRPKAKKKTVKKNPAKPVTKRSTSKSLISNDFFPSDIEIDTKKIFPMLVMATMSSGKSTLINALFGKQLLPSKNEACTSKMFSILDVDDIPESKIYITDKNGNTTLSTTGSDIDLQRINDDDSVSDVFICDDIKGVLNSERSLLVIDTPGPNNSRDNSHQQKMNDILHMVEGGLVLYVLNATQIGINDDRDLLRLLKGYLEKHDKLKVLFVINKADMIDEETESLEQLVSDVYKYLEDNGFINPSIIPVSALAALLFKQVINGDELTRKEKVAFKGCYELFSPKEYDMASFAILKDYPNRFEKVDVSSETIRIGDLYRAIDNTGITLLENTIQDFLILSSESHNTNISLKEK